MNNFYLYISYLIVCLCCIVIAYFMGYYAKKRKQQPRSRVYKHTILYKRGK